MDDETYAKYLGKLLNNIQSLELSIRAFLMQEQLASEKCPRYHKGLMDMQLRDIVEEDAFTNYDTLEKLIDKYNSSKKPKGHKIDKSLVKIRDALAHGRVASINPTFEEQKLIKFCRSEGKSQQVMVDFCANLTEEWFKEKINLFADAIRQVKATGKIG
jgi:hypothetical protein